MTHELKRIIQAYLDAREQGIGTVMATVVELEGSSYRRPGVRMLMDSNGRFTGAVSGGCVEKEIWRKAQEVFSSGIPKIMTYDGRYRLGCEGILYILIEPFSPDEEFINSFWNNIALRKSINCRVKYALEVSPNMGTHFDFGSGFMGVRPGFNFNEGEKVFKQSMKPCHQLIIVGAEHDAVQLSSYASMTGWEVSVVAAPSEEKNINHFPGAKELLAVSADDFEIGRIDMETSIVLMTHSYVKDLKYLISLKNCNPAYLGVLGPARRRENLLSELLEHDMDIDISFVERIHGPAGLNIGAETPQEIAISILAEILTVIRKTEPMMLKDKLKEIHH